MSVTDAILRYFNPGFKNVVCRIRKLEQMKGFQLLQSTSHCYIVFRTFIPRVSRFFSGHRDVLIRGDGTSRVGGVLKLTVGSISIDGLSGTADIDCTEGNTHKSFTERC